jgi:hypothetical protein
MDRATREFKIVRKGKADLLFDGVLLGAGSEESIYVKILVFLYKTVKGKYVFQFIQEGLSPENTIIIADEVQELLEKIKFEFDIYHPAIKEAFLGASDMEPLLRPYAVEEL